MLLTEMTSCSICSKELHRGDDVSYCVIDRMKSYVCSDCTKKHNLPETFHYSELLILLGTIDVL